MATMAENSAYNLLRKHRTVVEKKMKDDLEWFATELSDEDFPVLNEEQEKDVKNPRSLLRDDMKAQIMINPLLNWVSIEADGLGKFVKILKKKPKKYKALIKRLNTGKCAHREVSILKAGHGNLSMQHRCGAPPSPLAPHPTP